MSVQELTALIQIQQATRQDNLSIIDYYADFCAPCRQIAPKIKDLAILYPNVSFYKVDVENVDDAATAYNVNAMPTFHFWKNGILLETIVGANLSAFKSVLKKYA